jgi:hypothetical protein
MRHLVMRGKERRRLIEFEGVKGKQRPLWAAAKHPKPRVRSQNLEMILGASASSVLQDKTQNRLEQERQARPKAGFDMASSHRSLLPSRCPLELQFKPHRAMV